MRNLPKLPRLLSAAGILLSCAPACDGGATAQSGSGGAPTDDRGNVGGDGAGQGRSGGAPTAGGNAGGDGARQGGNAGAQSGNGGTRSGNGGAQGGARSGNGAAGGNSAGHGCGAACNQAGSGGAGTCGPDCDAGCNGSACLVCAPGTSRCVGDAIAACASDGTSESAPVPCVDGVCVKTGGHAACEPFVCTPGEKFCDATANRVKQCSSDGLSSSVAEDCAANGKACDGAACLPVVCAADQRFCAASSVHLCNALGTSSSLVATCSSTEHCDGAASPIACAANVCTPRAAACDGNTATLCNSDGSGYEPGGADCTTTARVCAAGACLVPVCTPGDRACDKGAVVECNSDALTTSILMACTASEYCDPVAASCRTRVCDPDHPVCAGPALTTCDALGAGPSPGGTSCAPDYCSSGACTSAMFFEDFEDGDYAGWWEPIPSDYTRTIATTGADGTTHSLCMTHLGPNGTSTGVMHTLPSIQPTYISWWARPQMKYSNFIEIYPANATSGWMIWQLYDDRGNISLVRTTPPTDIVVPHALTWYHTELKNLDWQQHTFDYYIDGKLIAAGVALQAPGNQIGLIDYFDYGTGTAGCIDQILMK